MELRVGETPSGQGVDDSVEEIEALLIRLRRTLSERIRSTNWFPQSLNAPKQPLRQSTTGLSACSLRLRRIRRLDPFPLGKRPERRPELQEVPTEARALATLQPLLQKPTHPNLDR